jgi:hypothetical protein
MYLQHRLTPRKIHSLIFTRVACLKEQSQRSVFADKSRRWLRPYQLYTFHTPLIREETQIAGTKAYKFLIFLFR